MGIFLFLVGYIVCIVLSMYILHKYKDFFDIHSTDSNGENDNASVILTFSVIWPLFYLFAGIFGISKGFHNLSKYIESKVNKPK